MNSGFAGVDFFLDGRAIRIELQGNKLLIDQDYVQCQFEPDPNLTIELRDDSTPPSTLDRPLDVFDIERNPLDEEPF